MRIAAITDYFKTLGKRDIRNNVQHYYLYYFSTGLLFTVPIWVMFYRRFLDFPQLAFLTVIQAMVTIALEVPTGAFADLVGKRKTILIGLCIIAASIIGVLFSQTMTHFLIFTIIFGVGDAFISGADTAILYDSLKSVGRENEFGRIAVMTGILHRIGLVIGSFAGGYLYSFWISLPYIMKAMSMLMGAGWVYCLVEPKVDSEKFSWANYVKQTKQGITEITKSPYIKKLTAYYVLVGGITWSCLYYFAQPFALDFKYNEKEMGILFGFVYLMTSVILYAITSIPGLLTRKRVYIGFPILMMASFLPAYFVPKLFAPLILLGVQLAGSARFAVLDKYTNKEFEPKNRTTANSTINMMVQFIMMIIIQAGGYIQGVANTRMIYSLLGVMTLIFVLPFAIQLVQEHALYTKKAVALAEES